MEQRFPPSDNRQSYPPHAPNAQPPMLSFRSFHERHFSISQRQAFFGAAYITPWHSQLPNWGQGQSYLPTGNDTVQSYQSYQPYQETPENESESKGPDECDAQEPSVTGDLDHGSLMPHLSKEAIEIFEFSRRFRQEKAAAAQLEQTRLRKRRTKRRKLTKLGFALDEGDSGSESNASADGVAVDGATKGVKAERCESNEEGHESDVDDDWDDDSVTQEPPPTDVSFLKQKSRRADMTRKELYGMDSSDNQNASEIGINEMLERLVNQIYEDSLGLLPTPPVEETRRDKRQRLRGEESQFVDRRNQVVYWPGLPLRC
ncbi:hypothetical protein BGZ79_004185 [Entomortierella chlamydospora]|nr:hypothetical protein BGZ79_004185 [Entomortierella chlamydospora]